jgi:hypothetical protein
MRARVLLVLVPVASAACLEAVDIELEGLICTEDAACPAEMSCIVGHCASPSSGLLRWAPPELEDEHTITLSTGETSTQLDESRDYVIVMPSTPKTGATTINGGHNVVLIGGRISIPDGGSSRALTVQDATGTVHIEGVHIECPGTAITLIADKAVVQIENVRVDGVYAQADGGSSSVMATWGGARELRIDRFTTVTHDDGFVFTSTSHVLGKAIVMHTDLTGADGPRASPKLLNVANRSDCIGSTLYPGEFFEVYLTPRQGKSVDSAIWPGTTTVECPTVYDKATATVTFPNLLLKGAVRVDGPPGGGFVQPGMVGLGYRSPGYLIESADP